MRDRWRGRIPRNLTNLFLEEDTAQRILENCCRMSTRLSLPGRAAATTITDKLNATPRYNFVIRRLLSTCAVAIVLAALPAIAGPDIKTVQSKLKDMGFYYGETDGSWGDETSAAVTRYQIRNGLEISGQLNAETLSALGLAEGSAPPGEQPRGDAWKILREQNEKAEKQPPEPESAAAHEAPGQPGTIVSVPSPVTKTTPVPPDTSSSRAAATPPPPAATPPRAVATPPPPVVATPPAATPPRQAATPPAPAAPPRAVAVPPRAVAVPPRAEAVPSPAAQVPPRAVEVQRPQQPPGTATQEQLRDYIAAFVLAGLSPSVEAELQFYAERVNYFGDSGVTREVIRRDLERYNAQYPQRRFWLEGDPQIRSETNETVSVDFPLRFEVSGASGSKSGKVLKSVELRKTGRSFEIMAVNERGLN
jgi:peptidoglycan hydrolase-like protein with peptidoglycan-binding domain